jgi:hypothetical protein
MLKFYLKRGLQTQHADAAGAARVAFRNAAAIQD